MHPREKQKHGNYEPDAHGTPLLVSVPEAARLLGVGKTFGWEMVRSGNMPSIKLGRRVLVPRAALERLISIENRWRPSRRPTRISTQRTTSGVSLGHRTHATMLLDQEHRADYADTARRGRAPANQSVHRRRRCPYRRCQHGAPA